MQHATVSRLQHVPQAYILCCACRWNDFAILSLQEAEYELKHNGTVQQVLQQEYSPTGFLTGKIGSMIKGLAGHYVEEHEGGFQRAPFWLKSAGSASSTWAPLRSDPRHRMLEQPRIGQIAVLIGKPRAPSFSSLPSPE